jgi:amino acid adenylation domain-containing protein
LTVASGYRQMTNLQTAISDLSPAARRVLLARLLQERASKPRSFPLSYAQQRLWVICQLTPASSLYNLSNATLLSGILSISALNQGLNETLRRHNILRASFTEIDGEPFQTITPVKQTAIPLVDLSGLDQLRSRRLAEQLLSEQAKRPFDLSGELMVRSALIRIGGAEHIFLFCIHHIVTDLWSMGLVIREIARLYRIYCNGKPSRFEELTFQYTDFATWQRRWSQGEVRQRQLEYWKNQLADAPCVLELPTDHARPSSQTFRGARQHISLSDNTAMALDDMSRAESVTRFMTLFAAFQILLYRCTGEPDFVVGTSVYHRNGTELEEMVGLLADLLAMRCRIAADATFPQLLGRVREDVLGALENRHLPFETLVKEIHPERNARHTPLFQVLFVLHNSLQAPMELPGLQPTPIALDVDTSKYDLALHITEAGQNVTATVEYNSDLFEAATVSRFLEQYRTLLDGISGDPARRIGALPLLTEPQQAQLLVEWNDTRQEYPDITLQGLFEQQAEVRPAAIALYCDGHHLSYRELNRRANQLAHYMKYFGVGPEVRVGISVERGIEMIVGVLGIVKAGGAYLPLDPKYPLERLAFMIEDSRLEIILSQHAHLERLPGDAHLIFCLDSDWDQIATESEENPVPQATAENVAYISYTSGSTGQPKGVEVLHRGIVRLVIGAEYVRLDESSRFLHLSPLSFDASSFEIWGALLNGGECILYPNDIPTTEGLGWLSEVAQVDTVWLTTSLFNLVTDDRVEALTGIDQLLVGGEALSTAHIRRAKRMLSRTRLINGYGPTEGTTFTCCHEIRDEDATADRIPIGRPICNTEVYVLGGDLGLVPINAAGQLYIGGAGLARGYLNRPQLTAEKFVPHPFSSRPGDRLYTSGDVVRYHADGRIDYLRRTDNQVKLRGFRIELGEIETVIRRHPGVRQAVVIIRGEQTAEKRVVAYVVPEASEIPAGEMRSFLRDRLPDYMVPSAFVALPVMPLSASGKVDVRALPKLDSTRVEAADSYVAPRDEVERAIASVWQDVLQLEKVGINDNFFDLGGHSLLLVRVNRKLCELFNQSLLMVDLFEYPTVSSLASHITQQRLHEPSFQHRYDRAATRKESMTLRRAHRRHPRTARDGGSNE